MCGIVGILRSGKSVGRTEIERLTAAVAHRGPDDEGVWVGEGIALGHRRLSIIDPERGHQPMSNHDGSIWLTYNGEIYNFKQLRDELEGRGHRFRTRSDTEVVIHAYEEWGENCVEKFRGMFAFAIADLREQRLFMARDHFGIKPLYYRITDESFTFASELTALRELEAAAPAGSLQAVDSYLRFSYIRAPLTIYKDVYKLPPAHCLSIEFNGVVGKPRRYWHLERRLGLDVSDEECVHHFREVLFESVRCHLVADVPFGALLSGGIDSTLVAQAVSEITGEPVKAFSLGFSIPQYSELEHAQMAAQTLGLELTTDVVDESLFDILPELTRHCGEPFGDSSIMPTWYLSRVARHHVPMVFSGDGGDEAFAGYTTYQNWLDSAAKDAWIPDCPRTILARWERFVGYYALKERKQLWRKDFHDLLQSDGGVFEDIEHPSDRSDVLWLAQNMDYQMYLPGDILYKMDIASMYHGLEVRTPFADVRVAEFAASLQPRQRLRNEGGEWLPKYLLKKSLIERFPWSFVHRPKQGFAIPRDEWLSPGTRGRQLAEQAVQECEEIQEWFEPIQVRQIFDQRRNSRGQLWLLIVLGLWLDANPDVRFA